MLSVLLQKKQGYRFYFVLKEEKREYGGGLTEDGFLVCDPACPQKELMLRTLLFKCLNDGVASVFTRGEWDADLARFGFVREGDLYRADLENMRLPHDCGKED